MILAVLELVPQMQQRQPMLEVLRFVEERVRTKPECLDCGVFEEATGAQRVVYMEQWRSAKDLHAHLQSGLYSKILQAMELACEEPRISFHEVSQTRSMDLITQLRSQQRQPVSSRHAGGLNR
jgi:quinol monooxygenase YgiN